MNNIFSEKKYRASPEGVSLMDEANNLASHIERSPLIHSYGYEYDGRPALALRARFAHANLFPANLSAGDRPTCFAFFAPWREKNVWIIQDGIGFGLAKPDSAVRFELLHLK